LAPDAARTLEQAERAQAVAQHGLEFRRKELQRLEAALAGIKVDESILALGKDITALDAQRHQYAGNPSALERYQGQLQQLGQQALRQLYEVGLAQEAQMA